jgi:Family of unknown function (DUF6459)
MTPPPPTSAGKSRVRRSAGRAVLPLVPGFERTPARARPLPDAAAVRLAVVPDSAPPYDDGRAAAPGSRCSLPEREHGGEQSRGRKQPRAGEQPRMASPGAPEPGRDRDCPGKEAAAGWPSQFAQVLAETLAGSRPQGQITPWTTEQARRLIRQLGPMLAAGPAPRVRRVLASRPAEGVVEMTVVVGCGPRTRALAVRLEQDRPHRAQRGRDAGAAGWVCTAVEAA